MEKKVPVNQMHLFDLVYKKVIYKLWGPELF